MIDMDISSFLGTLLGSTGAILVIIKFWGAKITDTFIQSYIEKTKAELDVKKYVTQQRFDKEYESVSKVLEYIYECAILTQNVYHYQMSFDDQKYKELITDFSSKLEDFSIFYFKNNLYINKNLSSKILEVVKKLNDFKAISEVSRFVGGKLESTVGMIIDDPIGKAEIERLRESYDQYNKELKEIGELINNEDQTLSYYTVVENAKDYFDHLSILQK
ncbi:hypothetical protein [Propionispira raffinosivorans]|uniref:hypothetical protein n=1 Tax=Propionispira raffinosivorans TaxID=86959 RepID=UPI0003649580|nr:hypothetical protein [Propionispira raffinosivorans]